MYEKKMLMMPHEFCVNTCPHCGQKFAILVQWDNDIIEQVGPRIYCYMCGKRFDEEVDNENTT